MRVNEIINQYSNDYVKVIKQQCSDFLESSHGLPLVKHFPKSYSDFRKVKVRIKKTQTTEFNEMFNDAFTNKAFMLRERAVFANGKQLARPSTNHDSFYIFPIDGFKFLYSTEVQDSHTEYNYVFDAIFEEFGHENGEEVIKDLLEFTYTSNNLYEGIQQGSEIIIYNIPYFYAVRTAIVENYKDLFA